MTLTVTQRVPRRACEPLFRHSVALEVKEKRKIDSYNDQTRPLKHSGTLSWYSGGAFPKSLGFVSHILLVKRSQKLEGDWTNFLSDQSVWLLRSVSCAEKSLRCSPVILSVSKYRPALIKKNCRCSSFHTNPTTHFFFLVFFCGRKTLSVGRWQDG